VIAAGGGALLLIVVLAFFLFPSTRCAVSGDFVAKGARWAPSSDKFAFQLTDKGTTRLAVYDLAEKTHRTLGALAGDGSEAFDWSPDGTRIAFSRLDEESWQPSVWIVDVETASEQQVGPGSAPLWSPDGSSLIVHCASSGSSYAEGMGEDFSFGGDGVCRLNTDTGTVTRILSSTPSRMSLSPRSGLIAFEHQWPEDENELRYTNLDDTPFMKLVDSAAAGKPRNLAQGQRELARAAEGYQADAQKEAAKPVELPYQSDIFVVDAYAGAPRQITSDHHSGFPSWTPDGESIAYWTSGTSGGELWLMDPDGGSPRVAVDGPRRPLAPSAAELAGDGRLLFFVGAVEGPGTLHEAAADLYVADVGGTEARRLKNKHRFKQSFAVSPDGKHVVYEVPKDRKLLSRDAGRVELWLMSP